MNIAFISNVVWLTYSRKPHFICNVVFQMQFYFFIQNLTSTL